MLKQKVLSTLQIENFQPLLNNLLIANMYLVFLCHLGDRCTRARIPYEMVFSIFEQLSVILCWI